MTADNPVLLVTLLASAFCVFGFARRKLWVRRALRYVERSILK